MKWKCSKCQLVLDVKTARVFCRCGNVETIPDNHHQSLVVPGWLFDHRLSLCKKCSSYREDKQQRCINIDLGCGGSFIKNLRRISGSCPRNLWVKKRHRYVRTTDLIQLSLEVAERIPSEVTRIIGIPRSGMMAASTIATKLHLPLFTVHNGQVFYAGGGFRMEKYQWSPEGVSLFVDDTSHSGTTTRLLREKGVITDQDLLCCVYTLNPQNCDIYGEILETPHILEWNLYNTPWFAFQGTDMDGIICHNPPHQDRLYHPIRNVPVKAIISSRPEAEREATVAWLEKHHIRYEHLVLWTGSEEDRWNPRSVAQWKAEQAHAHRVEFYIESEPELADLIRTFDLRVLCPQQGYLE